MVRRAKRARWTSPAVIKETYANASIVGDNRVVFNIKGNRYRLVVTISYSCGSFIQRPLCSRPWLRDTSACFRMGATSADHPGHRWLVTKAWCAPSTGPLCRAI